MVSVQERDKAKHKREGSSLYGIEKQRLHTKQMEATDFSMIFFRENRHKSMKLDLLFNRKTH